MLQSYRTPAHSTYFQTNYNDIRVHGEENDTLNGTVIHFKKYRTIGKNEVMNIIKTK